MMEKSGHRILLIKRDSAKIHIIIIYNVLITVFYGISPKK